jgi:carboxyl-terminal processing protease
MKNSPFLLAFMLVLGIFLGRGLFEQNIEMPFFSSRINQVLDQIEYLYVDSIDRALLEQAAVKAMVDELDPHSIYFSDEELEAMAEPLDGGFEGIGVEFLIQNDSLMVVAALPGGPSEGAGIRAGDRILDVDGEQISGEDLTNRRVMELLKGEGGSKVELGLMRGNSRELYDVVITRARIPIHSVVASFILEEKVGYVKVIRFAATTAFEFSTALMEVKNSGAESIIIDLRANGGGYLKAAIDMIDEFLLEGLDIVYTEGKASPRQTYRSLNDGVFSNMPIAVLIDESSASASEIFAGAIQDNDRGLIVGRRSFGKGLVQDEFEVPIEGALRLTVARFYTPSGRAIQKPYGEGVDYNQDTEDRFESGELFFEDSVQVGDTIAFKTTLGRSVYGGGGITPDIFVPLDSSSSYRALSELVWTGALRDGAFTWVDENRSNLAEMSSFVELGSSKLWSDPVSGGLAQMMRAYKSQSGYWPSWSLEEESIIELRFLAQVSRNLFGEEVYYKVIADGDPFIERALYELLESDWFRLRDRRLYLLPAEADSLISHPFNIVPNGF